MNRTALPLQSAVVLSALLLCGPAFAQTEPSPQHFAFEIKFGPYLPHIDDAGWLGGQTPFSDHFGDEADVKGAPPPRGLLTMGEFDYQFLNKFGSLGIGLEGGYYQTSGASFVLHPVKDSKGNVIGQQSCQVTGGTDGKRVYAIPPGQPDPALNYYRDCVSGDTDTLHIVPLSLLLVYRFDVLSKRFRIPIIPYMKAGFAYYFWWFGNNNSFVAKSAVGGDLRDTSGGSMGVVLHPGVSLDLSALDPRAAHAIDQELGLNRVALFAELNAIFVNGFGRDRVMNLSDTSISAGLSLEF